MYPFFTCMQECTPGSGAVAVICQRWNKCSRRPRIDSTSLCLPVRSPQSCCFVVFFWQKAPNVIAGGHFEFVTCSPLPTGCFQLIYEYLGLREQPLVCSIENFVCGCMHTCMRTYVRMYSPHTAYCFHPLSNTTLLVLHSYPCSNSTNSSTINSMIEMFSHGHAVFVPAWLGLACSKKGRLSLHCSAAQVANKLHDGRARARRAAIVCTPAYRPSTSHTAMGEGALMLVPQCFAFTQSFLVLWCVVANNTCTN